MTDTVKVLIADKMDPKAAAIFRDRGIEVDEKPGLSPDEFAAIIGDYDGLAVRSSTRVTAPVMDVALPRLKVIGRAGIGVDTIDVPAASARGIVVMNTPFGNSITTAEHAIAMLFALAREIPQADQSTQSGKWEKNRFMGVELAGKTLGLIGCGNIGSIVADRAHGLKMKVVAYDPFLSPERAVELGVDKAELDELLARADFITLHTPLTEQTRGILSRDALAKTKKGVRIVNCARGGLIDEAALKESLDSGHVAGAALDVFAQEPAKDNPLFGTPGLICTPHLGASTNEAQVNVAIQIAEQMSDFLLLGGITNAVNVPSLSAEEAPRLKPYMALAEKLGSLVGQTRARGDPRPVDRNRGRRGRAQHEADHRRCAGRIYAHLFGHGEHGECAVPGEGARARRARGAARPRRRLPHAVARHRGDCERPTQRCRNALRQSRATTGRALRNQDRGGPCGRHALCRQRGRARLHRPLGTALGEAGINIGTFHLGRVDSGGEAILLLSVDEPVGPDVIAKVETLPGVKLVRPLKF